MHSTFVRLVHRPSLRVLALLSIGALAACSSDVGSSRLKNTHSGMKRDSVLEMLGTGALTGVGADNARLVNGHRRQAFYLNGRMIEVVWYHEQPGSLNDSILPKTDTPVVFTNDTLAGWGWKYYLADGAKLGLVDPRAQLPRAMEGPSTTSVIPDTPKAGNP